MGIGNLIKDERHKKGLKLRELAKVTGVSFSYIAKIENNKAKSIDIHKVDKLLTALGVSITIGKAGED